MTTPPPSRAALWWSALGLATTLVVALVTILDATGDGLLAAHLRSAYPGYTGAQVATAVDLSASILVSVAVLGALVWTTTIALIATRRRGAGVLALVALVLGVTVSLTVILIRDTSGELGFALPISSTLLLPCAAGAVVAPLLLRRRRRPAPSER